MKHLLLCALFFSAAAWANPCKTNGDCPGSNNFCDRGQCTIYGTGGCTTNDDCPGSDNICDQGTCWCAGSDCGQSGQTGPLKSAAAVKAWIQKVALAKPMDDGDLCESNGDCNGGNCTAAGVCNNGGTNAPCDENSQCASGFCHADGTCE